MCKWRRGAVIVFLAGGIACLAAGCAGLFRTSGPGGTEESEFASSTEETETKGGEEPSTTAAPEETPEGYAAEGYVTYDKALAAVVKKLPNALRGYLGETGTSVQGMAVDGDYIYTVKITSSGLYKNRYANLFQYQISTGELKTVIYHAEEGGEGTPYFLDAVAHCNEMTVVVGSDGNKYMLTSNGTHLTSGDFHGMTVLRIDEENAEMTLCGFIDLKSSSGEMWTDISASAVRYIATKENEDYFLLKNANSFYWFKLSKDYYAQAPNKAVSEVSVLDKIPCWRVFMIDNRSAVFVDEQHQIYTAPNLENWTNQGFEYNAQEDAIYVPLYDQYTTGSDNVITVFCLDGRLEPQNLREETLAETLYPANLSFRFKGESSYEVESCGFDSEGNMYINVNGSASDEAIWKIAYRSGSVPLKTIRTENSVLYRIEYNGNAEGAVQKEAPTAQWKMDNPTVHINGIPTNLRVNLFVNGEFDFAGWYLYRVSDQKWSCEDGWFGEDEIEGHTRILYEDAQAVDGLTDVNGDRIIAYAQWESD